LREIINFVFIALVAGLLLFALLRRAIVSLMYLRISLGSKLIISFLFFLVAANIFFIRLTTVQRADFARLMQIDIINTIHNMLLSEGVTFAEIHRRWDMQYQIRERLERFFRYSSLREDYNTYANNKIQLTRVSVLDTEGQILVNATSETLRSFLRTRFNNESELSSYFSSLTKAAFSAYQASPEFGRGTFSFPIFDFFTETMSKASGKENIERYRQATLYFGDNGYITPIMQHYRLCGFYFFEVNGKSYSTVFGNALLYNLVLLAVIALLYFFLMRRTTGIMLSPLLSLIEGIRMVDKGRFDYNIDVRTHDEIEALGKAYNFMREKIEHYTRHLESEVDLRARELKRANAIYKEDLFLARRLQQLMLSSEGPSTIPGIEIAVSYHALAEVGGDFYSFFEPRKSCLRVFLADATGHGVPAALITMLIKSEYEKVKMLDDPVDILQIINESFFSTYGSLTVFFTGIIIDIDTARASIKWVSAGHPDQYLVRDGQCSRLAGRGRIIGVLNDPNFSVETRSFEQGDRLILYTDGLLEQINAEGDEYGETRLTELLEKEVPGKNAQGINDAIMSSQNSFRGDEEQVDDITIISIRHTQAAVQPSRKKALL
jgi:serine phosphatase RsbU (regulator of sigma subunit)